MFLVRPQVRHPRTKLSHTDYAAPLPPQIARFQNTKAFPHHPRWRPAQLADQHSQPLSRSVIQSCLNCSAHAPTVPQTVTCTTQVVLPDSLRAVHLEQRLKHSPSPAALGSNPSNSQAMPRLAVRAVTTSSRPRHISSQYTAA